MADVTTTSDQLKIDTYFVDGDTRAITLKNPKATITESELSELNTWMQSNQPIIGDKYGAAFGKITTVTKVEKISTAIDLQMGL